MNNFISFKRLYLSYSAWWLFWALAHFHIAYHYGLPLFPAIADALIYSTMLATAGSVIYNILRYYQPNQSNLFYLRIWALLNTIIVNVLFNVVMKHLFASDIQYLTFLEASMPVRILYSLLMIVVLTFISTMWFFLISQKQEEENRRIAEKLAKDAELVGLRQQLQPHFLFNSLNSISALAGSRPQEARKMIQQLSEFLRGTLKKDDKQLVRLEEELNHLSLYLEIEKVRFGHRLHTEIKCGNTHDLLLPPLLVQPLVENAIKFGLYDTTEVVDIVIEATEDENKNLHIRITNPFDPLTANPQKGAGFGLSSVQRRLYLLYARNDLLQTTYKDNIFTTTVIIPQV